MKYTLLAIVIAFLSLSFYPTQIPKSTFDSNFSNDSCFLENIIITTLNDSTGIDTTTFIYSYNENKKRKRVDVYFPDERYVYVIYEYDKNGRIKKLTDHFVLKNDAYGFSKGDVVNRLQKRFKYKKGAKEPKHYKYMVGKVWESGIDDNQLIFKAKSSFKYNVKGELVGISKRSVGDPKSSEIFTYDFDNNTILIKSISHTKSGDILEYTIENRYDKLLDAELSLQRVNRYHTPDIDNFRFGNNIIYSKMVYGEEYEYEKYRGKVAREYEMKYEFNDQGLITKSIKTVLDNFDEKRIGKMDTYKYEYVCQ